jgi:hypothetical protein
MKTLTNTENPFRNPVHILFWLSESRIWLSKCSKKWKPPVILILFQKLPTTLQHLYYFTTVNFIIPFGNMLFPTLTAE